MITDPKKHRDVLNYAREQLGCDAVVLFFVGEVDNENTGVGIAAVGVKDGMVEEFVNKILKKHKSGEGVNVVQEGKIIGEDPYSNE